MEKSQFNPLIHYNIYNNFQHLYSLNVIIELCLFHVLRTVLHNFIVSFRSVSYRRIITIPP